MIRSLKGTEHVTVVGGTVDSPYYQSGQSMSGMVRYNHNNFEVYDGITWYVIPSNHATISLSHNTEIAIEWVQKKMQEEELLLTLPSDHPAVKIAKENVNRAKQVLKEAEEQLKITTILSEEQ